MMNSILPLQLLQERLDILRQEQNPSKYPSAFQQLQLAIQEEERLESDLQLEETDSVIEVDFIV